MLPLYIVAGLIFAGVVVIFSIYYSNSMKMTSYMLGEVVSAEDRVVRDENERREETVIVSRYSVHGTQYTITHVMRGRHAKAYPPGRKITVWYNPIAPEMAKIKKG